MYTITIVIMYFYIILHELIWVNFGLSWLKHGYFFYYTSILRVLLVAVTWGSVVVPNHE